MEKVKITAAIIAKNEEKRIARCIDSVQWADDILVIDGYSDDNTVEIAKSKGARIIKHKFTGSFSDDRNAAMDNARHDWVLHLDADEIVTEGFIEKLRSVISNDEKCPVYKFRRKNFFLDHSMDFGGFHHYIPNFTDRRFVRFEGVVHETPVFNGCTGTIDADIEHHPFQSIGQFVDRQNRYASIAAKEILEKNGKLSEREIRSNMMGKSLKLFWKSYVKKQGYRGGMHSLIFAVLFAFINFLKWSKYWELVRDGEL